VAMTEAIGLAVGLAGEAYDDHAVHAGGHLEQASEKPSSDWGVDDE